MNPIGVISMGYARPFTAAHLPLFARMKATEMDCRDLTARRGPADPTASTTADASWPSKQGVGIGYSPSMTKPAPPSLRQVLGATGKVGPAPSTGAKVITVSVSALWQLARPRRPVAWPPLQPMMDMKSRWVRSCVGQ